MNLPLLTITGKEGDRDLTVRQVHCIPSFLCGSKRRIRPHMEPWSSTRGERRPRCWTVIMVGLWWVMLKDGAL